MACEVAIAAGLKLAKDVVSETRASAVAYDTETAALPRSVTDWLGLADPCGIFRDVETDQERSLVSLNDDRSKSFSEIADVIESQPLGLFRES